MERKLYIGNLPFNAKDTDLEVHFTQAGRVEEVALINDRETGQSRGFGFVTMADEEGAKKAIEMFNGKDYQGRALVVNEARPMKPREER